jgi:hypothetical protein
MLNARFSPPDFAENICFDGFLLTESLEIEGILLANLL